MEVSVVAQVPSLDGAQELPGCGSLTLRGWSQVIPTLCCPRSEAASSVLRKTTVPREHSYVLSAARKSSG